MRNTLAMKTTFFTSFLIAMLFIVSSCSKDSSPKEDTISQEQLEAISGLYNMTEYVVSPPQDLNNDDVSSENIMNELPCLSASIILREDLTFSFFTIELYIVSITGGQYAIRCEDQNTTTGTWDLVNNQIELSNGADGTYSMNGTTLTRTEGNDLPEFQRLVFIKQ